MRCPACGREAPKGDRFCGGCGSPLSGAQDVLDDLIRDYQKELADKPEDTSALYSLATALERKGRLREALAAWRRLGALASDGEVAAAITRLERSCGE